MQMKRIVLLIIISTYAIGPLHLHSKLKKFVHKRLQREWSNYIEIGSVLNEFSRQFYVYQDLHCEVEYI